MQSKAFLKSIRHEQFEIAELEEKREELYSILLPKAIAYKSVDVQESGPSDKMSKIFANIYAIDKIIEKRMERLIKKLAKAEFIIDQMEESRYRTVLELYYLGSKRISLQEVAEKMNYSPREIDYLHGDALKALDKIMRDNAEVSRESNLDPKSSSGNKAKS